MQDCHYDDERTPSEMDTPAKVHLRSHLIRCSCAEPVVVDGEPVTGCPGQHRAPQTQTIHEEP
jgi:hypothetical protein